MYSAQTMRKFVCDRLTVAAQEILGAFEKKVQEYEAEIARQRRMLDTMFTPEIKFSREDLPQTALSKDEQAALNRQRGHHETTCSFVTPIKDENEEMIITQDACASKSAPASDGRVQRDRPQQTQREVSEEPQTNIYDVLCESDRESLATSAAHSDNQEVSHVSYDDENQHPIVCSLDNCNETTASPLSPVSAPNRRSNVEKTTSSTELTQVQGSKKSTTAATPTESASNKRATRTTKASSNTRQLRGKTTSAKNTEPTQDNSKITTTTRDREPPLSVKGRRSTSTGTTEAAPKEQDSNKDPKSTRSEELTSDVEDDILTGVELLQSDDATASDDDVDQLWDIECFDYMLTEGTELIDITEGCDKMRALNGNADEADNTQCDDEDVTSNSSAEIAHDSCYRKTTPPRNPEPIQDSTASAKSTNLTPNKKASEGKTESTISKLRPKKKLNDQSTTSRKKTNEKPDKAQTKSAESNEAAKMKRHNEGSTDPTQKKKNKEADTTATTEKNTKESSTRGTKPQQNIQRDDDKATSTASKSENNTKTTEKAAPPPAPTFINRPPNMKDFVNPYKCDICNKEMSNFKNYKFHMKSHTVEKTFKCDTCGKLFRESWDLKKHALIHSTQKPFTCDVCGNGFNRRYNLDLHLRVHTGEKPYKCETCGKNFSSCVNMKKHIRIHTGEKPYTCSDCGKEFADSSSFKNHRRVHTGEKPFKCTYCKRKFATRTTMKRHTRTHTGEKPYKCNICDKVFGHRTDLKGHIRMHTGETPYKCSSCEKQFATWSQLNKHKRVHADDAQSSTSAS